jgi:hypothetical protein
METAPLWVGIDVARDQLDIAIGAAGETWSVPNDDEGIRSLVVDLRNRRCSLIVLEATGGFEIPVVVALAATGLPVVVANPRQVRNLRGPPASLRRRTAWTPVSSRWSQSACGQKFGCCPTTLHACWMRSSPGAGKSRA